MFFLGDLRCVYGKIDRRYRSVAVYRGVLGFKVCFWYADRRHTCFSFVWSETRDGEVRGHRLA